MNRPPRRPSSSRTNTPRPRKIAGRSTTPGDRDLTAEETVAEASAAPQPPEPDLPVGEDPERTDEIRSALASPRVTRVLLVVLAVFAVVLTLQGAWWVVRDVNAPDESTGAEVERGEVVVPDGRPVTMEEFLWKEGVAKAAEAASEIVAVDHTTYDVEVDAATTLMTDAFAEEYRATAEDVRDEIIARETVVRATVVGQGVVRANDTEVQALVFLNQFVTRKDEQAEGGQQSGDGEESDTVNLITPYKLLVTMVHTDEGWFVDGLETDAGEPAGSIPDPEEPAPEETDSAE